MITLDTSAWKTEAIPPVNFLSFLLVNAKEHLKKKASVPSTVGHVIAPDHLFFAKPV